jgi:Protein of unknown function (DUF4019)
MSNRNVRVGIMVLLALFVGLRLIHGQESSSSARTSAESWLALVDGQRYADSWQAAAAFFRNAVTADKWEEAVRTARSPLGSLKSRVVKSVTSTKTLPGAPDGQYVVFQFNTGFEHKAAALETVTKIRESDGNWRVVGYFVK